MRRPVPLIALLATALLQACGADSAASASTQGTGTVPSTNPDADGTPPAATKIDLAVKLTPFPWDPSLSSADPTNVVVRVGDPAPLLSGGSDATWMATTQVTQADCPSGQMCIVTFPGVETSGTTAGLWIQTQDARGSYSGVGWAAFNTAIPQSAVVAMRTAAAGASAAISTTDGTTQLATWSGVHKVDLFSNGALVGLIGDKNGQAVTGAALHVPDTSVSVAYANADFSAHTATPAASGTPTPWFLAAPSAAKVVTTDDWTLDAGSGATVTWTVPKVGFTANVLVFAPFFGNS